MNHQCICDTNFNYVALLTSEILREKPTLSTNTISPNLRTTLSSNNHTNQKNQTSTKILEISSSHKSASDHLYDLLMSLVLLLMLASTDLLLPINIVRMYATVPSTTRVHTRLFPLQPAYIHDCSHCNPCTCMKNLIYFAHVSFLTFHI
jgi:hypothetical protein